MSRPEVDGILVVDKPRDRTSMDVVRTAKRVTRVRRVGHAGTLDPIATGVLPVCFGQATRFMDHIVGGAKTYVGEITLGAATDTHDAHGTVTATGDPDGVDRAEMEACLAGFAGVLAQRPPMYSAVRHAGARLYELARAGIEVERAPREVVVHRIRLCEWAPPRAVVEVVCGKGFYMRTLAHEVGAALGCHAHLSGLTRTRAGPFSLDDAVALDAFADAEDWEALLEPPDAALLEMGAAVLVPAAERRLRNGQPVTLPGAGTYVRHLEPRRAYAADGRFLGLIRFDRPESAWRPEKVLARPVPSRHAPEG